MFFVLIMNRPTDSQQIGLDIVVTQPSYINCLVRFVFDQLVKNVNVYNTFSYTHDRAKVLFLIMFDCDKIASLIVEFIIFLHFQVKCM